VLQNVTFIYLPLWLLENRIRLESPNLKCVRQKIPLHNDSEKKT